MKNILNIFVISLFALTFAQTADANTLERCGNIEVEVRGHSAGLIYQPTPVVIAGTNIKSINRAESCAVVSWSTNTPATSQVLFAEVGDGVNMDATKENIGFEMYTTQNNSASVNHVAVINGLEVGKTYIYRVVSRSHSAAMPTVSAEYMLVMQEPVAVPSVATTYTAPVYTYTPPVPTTYTSSTNSNTVVTSQATEQVEVIATNTPNIVVDDEENNLEMVPAAITSVSTSFFDRLKKAFSFNVNFDLASRLGFLIPTLFILAFLYLLQRVVLPMIGIIVERPVLFWMFSLVVLGAASALMKYYQITLAMAAVFLAILAWYLFNKAGEEVKV